MTHELVAALHTTPGAIAQLTAELSDDDLDRTQDGEWSPRTIMAHLRDEEGMVMRMRLARMLAEDEPYMPNFSKEEWESRGGSRRDKRSLLADFTLQRLASVNLLQWLKDEQWERRGRHEVRGNLTVRSWVEHWVEHDREHLAQLERALGETLEQVLERRGQSHVLQDQEAGR